jgi:proline iminopeptidase
MASIRANGLTIEYESHGNPRDPCVLLIMGFNMQLTAWDPAICDLLARSGLYVIRFDNRDIGLSDRISQGGQPATTRIFFRRLFSMPVTVPYSLLDMAQDSVALLTALNIERAHVVGASMGGMIAQLMAIHFQQQVASLCSLMASTGEQHQLWPKPRMLRALFPPPAPDLQSVIDYGVRFWNAAASPDNPSDPQLVAQRVREALDRSPDLSGRQRQLAAIFSAPSRKHLLPSIKAPTQIIHGRDDPLVRASSARQLGRLIPGAQVALIDGMGHDLPPALHTRIAGLIIDNIRRAQT